jgi:glycosyltransferase involved in cell wall biosynthesis
LKYGIESQKYLLFLGRLVPEKRVEDLIEAYRPIPGDYKLVIAGDDSSPDAYVSKLRDLASQDPRVLFAGSQTRQAVHHLLRHATLFINPAELEGMPMTVLECIQNGTPIIASDIAPHRELLAGDSRYDLFFNPRDKDALKSRIASALAAIDRYRCIIGDIRDARRLDHSWEAIAEQTEQVYRAALGLQAKAETSAIRSAE